MSDILYVVSGLLVGLAFQGGLFLFAIPFALVALVLAWLNRPSLPVAGGKSPTEASPILRRPTIADATTVGRILRPAATQIAPILSSRDTFSAYPGEGNSSLDKLKGNEIWKKIDDELDSVFRPILRALKTLLPKAHSVLLFFKTGDGKSFAIRQFASDSENYIHKFCLIADGAGVVGLLSRQDTNRILEGNLPNGKSLGYYVSSSLLPVHSVAGVPLCNGKKQRIGALVVDSLEQNVFTPEIIPILDSFASMFYMLSYKSYVSAANYREKKKFYELAAYQQKFFTTTLLKDTYKEIFEYVNQNFISDRIMILVFDDPEHEQGTVAFCRGEEEKWFEGRRFSLSDKGILPLAMRTHYPTERVLNRREYVPRLNDDEPQSNMLHYLFVQPCSMTMRNFAQNEPSELAICLERRSEEKFETLEKDLLRFMVNIAYFAYQRGMQFEHEQFEIYHDALTGLLNRRTIDERILELGRTNQEKNVGIMMMDIDHFKHINDTYGHQAGDAILKGIAARISSVADKGENLLARYGGEEFFVAIPGATSEILKETAEQIRMTVCSSPFDIHQTAPIPVSVSIGCYLAEKGFRGEISRAVRYADDALYRAKETGRNRVVEYQERPFDLNESVKSDAGSEGTSDVHDS